MRNAQQAITVNQAVIMCHDGAVINVMADAYPNYPQYIAAHYGAADVYQLGLLLYN